MASVSTTWRRIFGPACRSNQVAWYLAKALLADMSGCRAPADKWEGLHHAFVNAASAIGLMTLEHGAHYFLELPPHGFHYDVVVEYTAVVLWASGGRRSLW